jgi:hypothetical protein
MDKSPELQCSCTAVPDPLKKRLFKISFQGDYPPGSQGNSTAARMRNYVEQTIHTYQPEGLIFDLTGLRYQYGDAIAEILLPLKQNQGFIPGCIVANGKTKNALSALYKNSLFEIAKCRILSSVQEAIDQFSY